MNGVEVPRRTSGCPVAHGALSGERTPTGCPVSQRAADFDPFEDGYQQDPPEYVRWAREKEPIFWSPKLGYWVVTRYDDIKAIFRDNITFSPSIALEKITPTGDEANAVLASYGFALNRTLVNEDEPAHMPRRRAFCLARQCCRPSRDEKLRVRFAVTDGRGGEGRWERS